LNYDNRLRSAQRNGRRPRDELGRGSNPLAVSRFIQITQTHRPVQKDSMGKWCRRYGASQAGLEPAAPDSRPAALSR